MREVLIWKESWATPQACAWAEEPWRWPTIAEFCRIKALMEQAPNAALIGQLHRYRDQIGLTPAGLRENGWSITTDEIAPKRAEPSTPTARRLREAG